MLAFAAWLGSTVWTTFVAGITMMRNLPRQQFGKLQVGVAVWLCATFWLVILPFPPRDLSVSSLLHLELTTDPVHALFLNPFSGMSQSKLFPAYFQLNFASILAILIIRGNPLR